MKTLLPFSWSNVLTMRFVRVAVMLVVVTMGAMTASCASKPTLKVDHARVTGVGPLGIGLDVVVRVYNSNSFDIMIRNVHAQTTLAGRYQLPAVNVQPNLWLPAKKETYVSTPVVVPWTLVPGVLSATMGSEHVSYHVQGYADVTATRALGVEVNNEPLDERGSVPREVMLGAARTMIPGAR